LIPLNDLSRRLPCYPEETAALSKATQSGVYFGGPFTRDFEAEFAGFVGVGDCVGVASGTDALTLALAGLGVGPGSVVATTANAGYYSTAALLRLGAKPVYVDVTAGTAMMDPASLKEVLAIASPAVVVVTHMYGGTAAIADIAAMCGRSGSRLLEDCAHSTGAETGGRMVGSFGDLAAFSFYPTKNLGALGDAGAVLGDDPGLMRDVRALAQYGWSSRFVVSRPGGTNSRLDEIQAAVLTVRLQELARLNATRREIMRRYQMALERSPVRLFFQDDPTHVAHLAVIHAPDRERIREVFTAEGVATEIHYPVPDHLQPVSRSFKNPVPLPVTEALADSILTVPCFPTMTTDETSLVCQALVRATEST